MELRQLEYFVTVVDEANFTRAAQRLHVAQPGVSAQVKQLERELGLELLDRSGRAVRPTRAGEEVLPYARAALSAVAGVRQVADELAGLMRGRVAVGMITSCPAVTVVDMLADFHRDHPAVDITLTEQNSDVLIESLRGGRIDVAVIALGATSPSGISTRMLLESPVLAAVSVDDPLAARTSMPITAIRDRDVISLPPGTGLRACLDQACARAGFQPRIAFEASDPELLALLAARGLGVAFLPEQMAGGPGLHAITVPSPALRGGLALAWREGGPASPAARALIGYGMSDLTASSAPKALSARHS